MTEAYDDALGDQMQSNVWRNLREEAASMSTTQRAQIAADIAGIFDPTPTSDAIGGILSLAQGDFVGAGLSVVGMVPYVGDAGKIGKIARVAPRTARALETLFRASDNIAGAGRDALKAAGLSLDQVAAARRQATEKVRRALLNARKRRPNCRRCRGPKGERRTLQMPKNGENGNWRGGAPDANGNGVFEFTEPKTLPDGTVVDSIEFRDGFPNFDNYVSGGKHDLWEVSGDAGTDASRLTRQMRETNPGYRAPSSRDYVLHHFEDGQVGYVPRAIHDKGRGGVAHTGGNSILNNDVF